ncbi:MAG: right-handed parallel beta-helix repeat-containing protein [Actinobacteria bacterium]|nr:right-handed parallel beta-helix repeat-containing protein [Actinomycetota bacterium]
MLGLLASAALPVRALAASAPTSPAPSAASSLVRLYVAPDGAGVACTVAHPCGVLGPQARTRQVSGTRDVDVLLAGGTYALTAPLAFDAADGGRNGHHVTYEAAPGATPLLSGGLPVTRWSVDGAGTWSSSVPAATVSRELYVDGKRAPRSSEALGSNGAWVQTDTGYTTTDTSILKWRNPSNIELVFNEGNGFWTEPRCDVASVAPGPGGATAVVTVRQPCWSNLHIPDDPASVTDPAHANGDNAMGGFEGLSRANPPSSVENVFELLAPGQWYLDQPAHRLFYKPLPGQTPATTTAVLPVLESLLTANGVANLTVRGLTFAHTTWLQPNGDNGFAEMQANTTLTGVNASGSNPASGRPPEGTCQYTTPPGTCPFAAWTRPPAMVTFHRARSVRFVGNTLTHVGAAGLTFDDGSQGNLVQGNEVTDTSGSGIQLGDTTDAQRYGAEDINDRNTISDNWVHDIAAEYHGGVGIWVGYTRHTVVAHNQIDHTPYTAISFGWGGWHTDTTHPDNPNVAGWNTIADNLIYDYMATLPDGGAIYTNGTQAPPDPDGPASNPALTLTTSSAQMARGLLITGNIALLATWSEFAYYNDEGSDYITYRTNAEYQAHALAHGGCNTIGHLRIDDNYWAQPIAAYICPPAPVDVNVSNHHVLPDHPGPGDLPESLTANAGLEPAFRALLARRPPEVSGVGPQQGAASAPVLVSGSGFTPDTAVLFGATRAASVRVLSANYLVATPPASAAPGQVDITVHTPAGTSAPNTGDQYTIL